MFEGHKIVTCCPAGRERYLEVLFPFIKAARGLVDEHHWWLNTQNKDDERYIRGLAAQEPGFSRIIEHEGPGRTGENLGVSDFYRHAAEDNTIYIKVDDDIAWIHPQALQHLVAFRVRNPAPLLVYPSIVNNVICSYYHQQSGALPSTTCTFDRNAFSEWGWRRGEGAELVHRSFLAAYNAGQVDKFMLPDLTLNDFVRVSINVVAWWGHDMRSLAPYIVGQDDELMLSCEFPAQLRRPCVIHGRSLVSHYAYRTQRDHLDAKPDILASYKTIANSVA